MCDSVGKADLRPDHFDSKQSRESVDLPLTCHLSPSLITFVCWSCEVGRLLLGLALINCDTDPMGMFPLFMQKTDDVLAPVSLPYLVGFFIWVVSLLAA